MTSSQIRQQFVDFFVSKGHRYLPESSLVPKNDPSVLLTTAGMQQFKEWFTHPDQAKSQRVITIQPSFRTTDIEEVGDDTHLTLFEMMGNFSFGDYYKSETVRWWLEFLELIGVRRDRVVGTVFKGDKTVPCDHESIQALTQSGIDENRVKLGSREDNFWGPTGREGPCGPSIELYVDNIEIGTLVFNEYYCHADKKFESLKHKGVDVGIGLERLAGILQGIGNVYETDEYAKILSSIPAGALRSRRIIADHIRGIVFLVADGVEPSNVKQGYILRRLIRRASTHGRLIGAPDSLLTDLVDVVIMVLGDWYKKLDPAKPKVQEILKNEQAKFFATLERAHRQLEKIKAQAKDKILSGRAVFDLQATHGLPIEITQELAVSEGYSIDKEGLKQELEQHQDVSRG